MKSSRTIHNDSNKHQRTLKDMTDTRRSLYDEILPKLRPFQREALEFATQGTPYRHYNNNKRDDHDPEGNATAQQVPAQDFSLSGKGRILLADEMGLGKTISSLAIASYYQRMNEWPLLILCPASLKYTWPSEMEKFWPSLPPSNVHVVSGFSDVSWIERMHPKGPIQIVIVTYSLFQKRSAVAQVLLECAQKRLDNKRTPQEQESDQNQQSVYFPTIIADESHNLKQREAQRTQMILPLLIASKRLMLLSGTPALARPAELYTQLHAIAPSMFGTKFKDFADRYCAPKKVFSVARGGRRFPRWDYSGAANLDELHTKLKHIMVRRLKQDVLDELPPKQRSLIPVKVSSDQLQACKQAMKDVHERKVEPNQESFESKRDLMNAYQTTGIGKVAAVTAYLVDWLEGSDPAEKIVVFAHHKKVMAHINDALHRHFCRGNQRNAVSSQQFHILIDGEVAANLRHNLVRKFQTQPQTRVALLSMTAAGVGLTLTAASTVLFAELNWTPGILSQAEDRVHRLGQAKVSQVLYCIDKDSSVSIDSMLCRTLGRKIDTILQVVDGTKDGNNSFLAQAQQLPGREEPTSSQEQNQAQSGQEELTNFFASMNQSGTQKRRNTLKGPVFKGSIESFFQKATTGASKRSPMMTTTMLAKTPSKATHCSVLWSCSNCTFAENDCESDQVCSVCGHDRPVLSQKESGSTEKIPPSRSKKSKVGTCTESGSMISWNCEMCTYANRKPCSPDSVYACTMCGDAYSKWARSGEQDDQDDEVQILEEELSYVTPTPKSKKRGNSEIQSSASTEVIVLDYSSDEDNKNDVIEILDTSPQTKKTRASQSSSEQSWPAPSTPTESFLFSVSKHSGRITIHQQNGTDLNSCISTNVNFDLDQVLSTESAEDLMASQTRGNKKLKSAITFSEKGLEDLYETVQKQCKVSKMGQQQLFIDVKAFVSCYLRLRQVEKKAIQDVGTPFSLSGLAQAAANVHLKRVSVDNANEGTTERYAGGAKERAYEKKENGDVLKPGERAVLDGRACAWCGGKLSLPQQRAKATYCSQECAEVGRLRRGGKFASVQIRSAMFALEGGKCTLCNVDAHALYEQILTMPPPARLNRLLQAGWRLPSTHKAVESFLQNPKEGNFWQIDHIVAVAEGGGNCGLENLRTLCVPCHLRETEKLRARLKLQSPTTGSTNADTTSSSSLSSADVKKTKQMDIRSVFASSQP